MTLTPEQFNILVTKEDVNRLENAIPEGKQDSNDIKDTLDVIVSELKKMGEEKVSNQAAHERINRDLLKIKEQANINDMEVIEQLK